MKLFKKIKYLKLAHHIKKNDKVQELKDLPQPVKAEDFTPEQRQEMIKKYNAAVNRSNRQAEKLETEVDKKMKKKAKLFDKALFEALKSGKKYLYVINHTQPHLKFEYKITNHSRGIEGYKRIKLKSVRKEFKRQAIDFLNMTYGQWYELETKHRKEVQ